MQPLLMIPGPIEVSTAVKMSFGVAPPSHVSKPVIEALGSAIERMRSVWLASSDSQPFVIAGSGTIAMDMAACNVIDKGDKVLVPNSGFFSDRMAIMLERRGAEVVQVRAVVGHEPSYDAVAGELAKGGFKALFATHVDTSTGVRVDAQRLAAVAREHGALSVFDGVCATAGERFEMEAWGADVYLTASQKAVGLPAGLALMVVTPRALEARARLSTLPPMSLDFTEWLPVMRAYEERRPSYFSTPATNHVLALNVSLAEVLDSQHADLRGIEARFALHKRAAVALRAAWSSMGLTLLCEPGCAANTLSAVRYPDGVDGSLPKAIAAHGVIVAGGLHPSCKGEYFRVGHMGEVVTQPENLLRTVDAVAAGLADLGHAVDPEAARAAAAAVLG